MGKTKESGKVFVRGLTGGESVWEYDETTDQRTFKIWKTSGEC